MIVEGKGPLNTPVTLLCDEDGRLYVEGQIALESLPAGTNSIGSLTTIPGLDIPTHDYVACSYTGSDLTGVVYKTGGSSGTTVATLTLAYTDGKLTSVTKS